MPHPIAVLLSCLFAATVAGDTNAGLITYDLRRTMANGGNFDFGSLSGVFTDSSAGVSNGLEITVQAFVGVTASGLVNADALGVNAPETGDATAQLDGDLGNESLRFSFNDLASVSSVVLTEIEIFDFFGADSGTLTIGANSTAVADDAGTTIPFHLNLEGNSFTVAYNGTNNGFGLESITLDVTPTLAAAVPEPSTFAFLGLLTGGVLAHRVRRRRRNQPLLPTE